MRTWTVSAFVLLLVGLAAPATARFGFPEPITERAKIIDDVYAQIFIAGIIVFLFVFALLAYTLYRYRETGGAGRATFEHERDNLKAEMLWTIIPLIIVMWVGFISYQALVELDGLDDPDMSDALVIDIIASQYAWTAQYDNGVKVTAVATPDYQTSLQNAFHVPANHPILFRISAMDVIHSFNVDALRTTVDAVPGQINELWVPGGFPEGDYFTQCKEDCLTPGHSYMRAAVFAESQADYEVWVEETLAGAAAGVQQIVPVLLDDDGLQPLKSGKVAKGAEVTVQLLNNDTVTHTFTVAGQDYEVGAAALVTLNLNATEEGTVPITTAAGHATALEIVEPNVVKVELLEFAVEPGDLTIGADDLVLFEVTNNGRAVHNLYIGIGGGDGVIVSLGTRDLTGGDKAFLLLDGLPAGDLEMWCAVPGHYASGMYGTVTVA